MAIGAPRLGPKPPEVTPPIASAFGRIPEHGAFAHRRAAFGAQADAAGAAARTIPARCGRPRGSRLRAPRPRDGFSGWPRTNRRNRGRGLHQCHAHTGTAPLPAASCRARQARWGNIGVVQQGAGKAVGLVGEDRNFIPVLARVAGAGHPQRMALPVKRAHIHEAHRRHAGQQRVQRGLCLRPLQRQKRAVVQLFDLQFGQLRAQMRHIRRLARGIDDQKQVIAAIGDHQVIQNAALRHW